MSTDRPAPGRAAGRPLAPGRAAGCPLALGLVALLGLLTGCASTADSAGTGTGRSIPDSVSATPGGSSDPAVDPLDPTDLVTPPSSSGAVTVQPPTSPVQPSTVSVPTAGLLACGPPYLRIATRGAPGGLSHAGYVLLFTNTGQIPCSMTGYPGLAILDGHDRQLIQPARTPNGYLGGLRNPKPPFPTVVLAAGGTASALLEGLLVDSKSGTACPTERALLSTPPGTDRPIKLAAVTAICSQVQIHPVVAGSSGSQP